MAKIIGPKKMTLKFILTVILTFFIVASSRSSESVKPIADGTVIESLIRKGDAPFKFIVRVKNYGIEKIDVYSSNRSLIQSIEFPDYAEEMPCSDCKLLDLKDINFDGFNDLLILVGWGSGGEMYEPWTYNASKKKFEKVNFDREFANPSLDPKNKTLILSSHMGCCEGTISHYKYKKGRFVLVKEESYFVENKRDVVVVRQLVNGKWRVTSKKYGDLRE